MFHAAKCINQKCQNNNRSYEKKEIKSRCPSPVLTAVRQHLCCDHAAVEYQCVFYPSKISALLEKKAKTLIITHLTSHQLPGHHLSLTSGPRISDKWKTGWQLWMPAAFFELSSVLKRRWGSMSCPVGMPVTVCTRARNNISFVIKAVNNRIKSHTAVISPSNNAVILRLLTAWHMRQAVTAWWMNSADQKCGFFFKFLLEQARGLSSILWADNSSQNTSLQIAVMWNITVTEWPSEVWLKLTVCSTRVLRAEILKAEASEAKKSWVSKKSMYIIPIKSSVKEVKRKCHAPPSQKNGVITVFRKT